MSDLPVFDVERVFDAPRPMVWRAWTDPDLLQRWYGPGIETVIHAYDLTPGGAWLNEMKMKTMSDFSKMVFQEIDATSKLIWHHSSSDAEWNIITSPMMPDWPRVLLTTVTFEDRGDKTSVRLTQVPLDATDAEIACFAKTMEGMKMGWGGGYKIIDEILAELQAG